MQTTLTLQLKVKHRLRGGIHTWQTKAIFTKNTRDAWYIYSFPVAQMVEHGASNAKIMDSIPRESKSW